jgi:lysyl-tRNA synthetase class I
VSAEPGYGGSVDFCTHDHPDIEDSFQMGILSQEQYDEYTKARQVYNGQRKEIDARTRLTNFVREVGREVIQEHLDELDQ